MVVGRDRALIAAGALALAPLLLLAGAVVLPANSNDVGEMVDIVVAHSDRVALATFIGIGAQVLLIPALIGLSSLAGETRLARAGCGLAVVGVIAAGLQSALGFFEWKMRGGTRGEMVALLDRLEFSTGTVVILVGVGLLPLGLLLLSAALWRAQALSRWAAAGIVVGAAGTIGGYEIPSRGVRIGAAAVLLAALVAAARRVATLR